MKAKDIIVGVPIAATEENRSSRNTLARATKVEAIEAPLGGYVRIRFLETPKYGFRKYKIGQGYERAKKGETRKVLTRYLRGPWEEVGPLVEAEKERERKREEKARTREARLESLQHQVDALIGNEDRSIRWGGFHYDRESEVVIATTAFEALLSLAEAKP